MGEISDLGLPIGSGPAEVGGSAVRSACSEGESSGTPSNDCSLALAASDSLADSLADDAATNAAVSKASAVSGAFDAAAADAALGRFTEAGSSVMGVIMTLSSPPPPQAVIVPTTKRQRLRLTGIEYLQREFMMVISLRAIAIFGMPARLAGSVAVRMRVTNSVCITPERKVAEALPSGNP